MNYNNDNFNYSSLIFNKKYRSRLILAIYTILFIILMKYLLMKMKIIKMRKVKIHILNHYFRI